MGLTKEQIKEFKEAEKYAGDSSYNLTNTADEIAEAGDKEWAKKVYKKAEKKADNFSEFFSIGYSIIENLDDLNWARKVYKKAEETAENNNHYKSLAESIGFNLGDEKWSEMVRNRTVGGKKEYQITVHGSGGEITIGEIGKEKYLLFNKNNNDQERFIFGDHSPNNKVETIYGLCTEAKIEVDKIAPEKSFIKKVHFIKLVTDKNTRNRTFNEKKYYFLGIQMNKGESFSCKISEEFDVSRLKYRFVELNSPQISEIVLTDISYSPVEGGEDIQFGIDGDTTDKGRLFTIFKGSDCAKKTVKNKATKKKAVKKVGKRS